MSFRRALLLLVSVAALDVALFMPGFVFSHRAADVLPFFPDAHPLGPYAFDVRSGIEYLKALFVRRANLDAFRLCLEYVALLAVLILTVGSRWRRAVLSAAVASYTFSALFLTYHAALHYFFMRRPAVLQDVWLLKNLGHFLSEMGPVYWLGFGFGGAAGLAVLGGVATRVFAGVQRWAEGVPFSSRARGAAVAVGAGLASVAWFGPWRDDPVVQCLSKRAVENLRASLDGAARDAQLSSGAPDQRYDTHARLRLARRPSFYLLMIEAYGEVLSTWDMTPAYRALLTRVEARLAAKGLRATSFLSAAPVHGGWSWFSIATTQTGTLIDTPQVYAAFEENRAAVPTLVGFFKQQGYATWSLQPGSSPRPGIAVRDAYEHQWLVDGYVIGYHGRRWGFGGIPDQYAFQFLLDHAPGRPDPLYLFYMAVSTHFPWGDHVPPYVKDARALERGVVEPTPTDATWPPLPEKQTIGSDYRRSYFESVEYEWRVLVEFLEHEAAEVDDLVVVVMGDHQPRLESNPPGEVTMNTPVHIIARDQALLDSFAFAGAQPGLYADPARGAALRHEGLMSLFVSRLTALYGDEQSTGAATWWPEGAEVSGLRRRGADGGSAEP